MGVFLTIVLLAILAIVAIVFLNRYYRKSTREVSLVRTGAGGRRIVLDGGTLALPFLHKISEVNMRTTTLEIERLGPKSIITADRLRIDIGAEFHVRVEATEAAVATAAQALGGKTFRAGDLADTLEGKLVDAMLSVAARYTMDELQDDRAGFARQISEALRDNLARNGLLLESESLWRQAESEAVARLGLPFTEADFVEHMGVRMRDVARIWYDRHPWQGPTPGDVADQVIDRVVELVAGAVPLPGVIDTLDLCASRGLRLALCSSSDRRLIDAVLTALDLESYFEVSHSAEHDEYGKPHPQPYLSTAAKLGVGPKACLAFEDSVAGCLSAKSAGMRVVAVPDADTRGLPGFGIADLVMGSLSHFDGDALDDVILNRHAPNMARPRFHLAFPVDDLDAARSFYGGVLGCVEGRSADTWVDFSLWGHQVVAHLSEQRHQPATNPVDGQHVPAEHFGLLLHRSAWNDVVERLQRADTRFIIEPTVRFAGLPGEQHTCFVLDPAGNALEFKAFTDDRQVFARTNDNG